MNMLDEELDSDSLPARCDLIFFPCMELRLGNQIFCVAVSAKCSVHTALAFHLGGLQLPHHALMLRLTRSLTL